MHAIRIVVVFACAVAALGALAPPVLAASNPIPIHLVKDCSMFDGEVPSLLGPGLIVGAVLVFLGVGLLLRLRLRGRKLDAPAMPSRFHPSH